MPHTWIHSCWLTNWKPATPFLKANSTHNERPPVTTLLTSAVTLTRSGRREETRVTSSAPMAGISTSTVRMGKPLTGCLER